MNGRDRQRRSIVLLAFEETVRDGEGMFTSNKLEVSGEGAARRHPFGNTDGTEVGEGSDKRERRDETDDGQPGRSRHPLLARGHDSIRIIVSSLSSRVDPWPIARHCPRGCHFCKRGTGRMEKERKEGTDWREDRHLGRRQSRMERAVDRNC